MATLVVSMPNKAIKPLTSEEIARLPDDYLITEEELRRYLRISRSTLYRYRRDYRIPVFEPKTRPVRYHLGSIREWMRSHVKS